MAETEKIMEAAFQAGVYEAGWINTDELVFHEEIRKICEGNSCRNYNTSWACPPAIGTLEECKERVAKYKKMLLFTVYYPLKDGFDFAGMVSAMEDFKKVSDVFHLNVRSILSDFLLLSNEGCGRCKQCTYPERNCRFPDMLHHSLEGYGFMVNDLAKLAGVHYNNGKNTVTYFGGLLV